MNKPKKKPEKTVNNKITEKVLKYWFIDAIDKKVKRVEEYTGPNKLISFDSEIGHIITDNGQSIRVYLTYREASITLYGMKIEERREQWLYHVEQSMKYNKEISELLDMLSKLRREDD